MKEHIVIIGFFIFIVFYICIIFDIFRRKNKKTDTIVFIETQILDDDGKWITVQSNDLFFNKEEYAEEFLFAKNTRVRKLYKFYK